LAFSRSLIAAIVASLLLPLALADMAHGMALRKSEKPRHPSKPAAKAKSKPAPAPVACEPAKFRLIVDVGHTSESPGADSARNEVEFGFNLQLAKLITARLKSEGFAATRLLITEGKARPSLFTRIATARAMKADIFLAIHHDSVPDKFKEKWEFEGKKLEYSDRFSGYSLFVSRENPYFETSFQLARLIGQQLKGKGLKYADQYASPIMGKYRHDLLDKDVGVYRYDHLVVLMRTTMPAVLLEAGSIINRDEEVQMASIERQDMITGSVAAAFRKFCGVEPETVASGKKN